MRELGIYYMPVGILRGVPPDLVALPPACDLISTGESIARGVARHPSTPSHEEKLDLMKTRLRWKSEHTSRAFRYHV